MRIYYAIYKCKYRIRDLLNSNLRLDGKEMRSFFFIYILYLYYIDKQVFCLRKFFDMIQINLKLGNVKFPIKRSYSEFVRQIKCCTRNSTFVYNFESSLILRFMGGKKEFLIRFLI